MELQTVKTLIRLLLLLEQSDLGLHCLPRRDCPKTLDHYGIVYLGVKTLLKNNLYSYYLDYTSCTCAFMLTLWFLKLKFKVSVAKQAC